MEQKHFSASETPCISLSVPQLDQVTDDAFQKGYNSAWQEIKSLWESSRAELETRLSHID